MAEGKNRIMIYGPQQDGTYVVEFKTATGEALAISIPRTETALIRHFQERMPDGLFVPEDKWPTDRYSAGSPNHIHALGVISLNYNLFESMWWELVSHYAGATTADFLLGGKVTDEWRIEAVRHYSTHMEKDQAIRDRIEHVAKAYAVCGANRNILMHSKAFYPNGNGQPGRLSMMKISNSGNVLQFHFSLEDLRRVADDMHDGFIYLWDIMEIIQERDHGTPRSLPATLPRKSLSPHKLDPVEIPKAHQNDQAQRESSQE